MTWLAAQRVLSRGPSGLAQCLRADPLRAAIHGSPRSRREEVSRAVVPGIAGTSPRSVRSESPLHPIGPIPRSFSELSAGVSDRDAATRRNLRDASMGWLICALLFLVINGVVEQLKVHVPVSSLALLYLLIILPIAGVWGIRHALAVSIASMLAFNFFFLPPVFTLTLADPRNWLALLVYVVSAVAVSELATQSRRKAREMAMLARAATWLLEYGDVSSALDQIAAEVGSAIGVEGARIRLDMRGGAVGTGELLPLVAGGRLVGTVAFDWQRRRESSARRRVLPALASLLAVAVDRERLGREALEAETLRRSDAVKTAVLRAVSHDLRNPLMAILASASALACPDLALEESDRIDLVATVLDETQRLDRLVGNLLDLSRLEAGAAQPEAELVTVDDLVAEAIKDLGADARRVDVSLPENAPVVRIDLHQVQRVLANLIDNALKYSPDSELVSVRVAEASSEVLVRVIDRGPGVAPDESERIFSVFQRGSGTRSVQGAGLGLAIARGFADLNGGRIWVESDGRGATFVLALPVVPVEVCA